MKKLKRIMHKPIKWLFKHDIVLKISSRCAFYLFFLFSFAWFTEYFFNDFFTQIEWLITIGKNTLFLVLFLLPFGYFISKFNFCITTLTSVYMIIFLLLFWTVNKYVSIPNYKEINLTFIGIAWLVIVADRINNIVINKK